jgi:hypothetical protein
MRRCCPPFFVNGRGPACIGWRRVLTTLTVTAALLAPSWPAGGHAEATVPDTTWPPVRESGKLQYADPAGLCRVVGAWPMEQSIWAYGEARNGFPHLLSKFWPGYGVMLDEGGDWWLFKIGLRPRCYAILSAKSTVTLVDKNGRTVTGRMRLLRSPDFASRDIWDAQERELVVSYGGFLGTSIGPTVAVRFPSGTVKWKDIRSFTVDGVRVLREKGGE